MNNMLSQQILVVKIETVDRASINTEQVQGIIAYKNQGDRYFLSTGIERVKTAMTEALPYLGKNYHTCLLFDVRVLSGNEADAVVASIEMLRRQRKSVTLSKRETPGSKTF